MVTTGLVVRLEARAGKEEALAAFLEEARALVAEERNTVAWLALRLGACSFAIVDVFPDEEGREEHLVGPVAAALRENAPELLAKPPVFEWAFVQAAKLP
jgi:quinol monooxygenase YgiN